MKRALLAICCAGTTLLGFNPASANEEVINLTHLPSNWALPTGNYANWRYSELYQITSANVWQLKHVATLPIDADSFNEGSPLVINDTMYLVTKYPHKVYAFDIKGIGGGQFKLKWKYEPKLEEYQQPLTHVGIANRGLAYADGKIILQRLDGMVVALKASTTNPDGEVVWSAQNGISGNGESNTAAVMPVKDKVIVGLAAAERTARCHLTAYNLKTGQRVWRAFSVGPDEDTLIDATTTYLGKPVGANSSLKTWLDNIEAWKTGGGCTWGWYSYDPELNLLYYGSGNPANWNPSMRPGDNRWTTTIFARDVDTGKAKWVYQMTPHDEWDYDGVNEMILADITVAGLKRKVLVHFDKNGFAYTLDRATGELLVAAKYDPKVNWATKVDMDKNSPTYGRPLVNPQKSPEHTGVDIWTNNICPHEFGTKNRHPAAFSPETGLFYVPINRRCMNYIPHWPSEKDPCKPGKGCKNATTEFWKLEKGIPRWGSFIVWDAGKGQMVGSPIRERDLARGGALATAGGLVFYITTEVYYGLPGHACLKAFDLKTSKTAFEFCNAAGFAGDVMTFAVGGRQYVAVFSGNPQQYPGGLGPLLVFALVPTLPPKIVLYCATAPCRPLIEDIREGCKQKWNCPSCAPGGLCPPYHHIIFDKTVQQWKLDLVDAKHQRLPHEITQRDEHVILTFRPSNKQFKDGQIRDIKLIFSAGADIKPGTEYRIGAELQVSDRPLPDFEQTKGRP